MTKPLNVYKPIYERSRMLTQDTQCLGNGNTLVFTRKQMKDIQNFKKSLENGNPEFAFEGSLLEGEAFLRGVMQIVETVNH